MINLLPSARFSGCGAFFLSGAYSAVSLSDEASAGGFNLSMQCVVSSGDEQS
jgi:hypothetical protein